MPKFNRREMLEACQRGLEGAKRKHEEAVQAYHDEVQKSKQLWQVNVAPQWIAWCDHIKAKAERDVLTQDDLSSSRFASNPYPMPEPWRMPRTSGGSTIRPPEEYRDPSELLRLITLLELMQDDTVSTSALKEMQFSASTVGTVMNWIAAGRVEKEPAAS